ncbi:MAG: hypothetical protein KAF91_10665 [Nostoc sp. TH1S01]|nr:hypothetical protein [Nostoc sp. TH1S01]
MMVLIAIAAMSGYQPLPCDNSKAERVYAPTFYPETCGYKTLTLNTFPRP